MKTALQLREEIGAQLDRAAAIVAVATEQNRELTADEATEIDTIQGKGKAGEAGHQVGKVGELEEQLKRIELIEARQAQLAGARVNGEVRLTQRHAEEDEDEAPRAARIKIPAKARYRTKALTAYVGPYAEQEAYLAGRFFLATLGQHEPSKVWCREHGVDLTYRAAMVESSNELGGFLVPEEVEQAVIDLREQYGVFRRNAYVTPMAGDTKTVPRRKAGLTAYFVGETESAAESNKLWDRIRLVAEKLYVLTRYSRELSEDAIIDIGNDLTQAIAYAFAIKEDTCGFLGDGSETYGGITGLINALAAGSIVTAAAGNTGFESLDLADYEKVVGKLPQYAEDGAKWYIHKVGWANSMMRLMDAAGGNTAATIAGGPPQKQFLGYPVEISQVLNSTLGADVSKVKLFFGNLKMSATLGNRRGMSIAMSEHVHFATEEIAILGTQRFAIVIHQRGTASDAGAMLALKTPGA